MIWAAVYERGTIMIRFLLVAVIVIGFLILSIPVLIVEWIIGKILSHDKRNQLSPADPGRF